MVCFAYNIHDIIKFEILIKDRFFLRSYFYRFQHEFEYFKTNHVDNPDFTVEVGPFKPDTRGCYSLEEDQFFIKENYLYTRDSYKIARWEVEISDLDKAPVKVKVNPNFSGHLFFGPYIIDFLLRVKMNQKGYPFIHGSGVVKDGKAFIFPARSSSGKTITTMHFLDNGFNLLGDNFVIIANKNKVYSFPSSMNVFNYNLAPKIKNTLSQQALLILKLKHLLYKATCGYIKIFTPVSVKKLFPEQICNSATVETICLLQVSNKYKVDQISKADLVESLLLNNQMDAYPFINYITEFAYVYPDHWLSCHWHNLRSNYQKLVENIDKHFKVTLPRKISSAVLAELDKIIN